jgi:FAD/FMN-containing dehydrogenase/Fe-S oxidoreductase
MIIPGFSGQLHTSEAMRRIYATDASAYREVPIAVAYPKSTADIQALVHFANKNNLSLIPRAAGTSLAGQVVGGGIVVDVSKHFTQILEINADEKWVRVQPGIIRDELNRALKYLNLFFAPETSTANRAMIGGMIGNNSCGSNSIVYGSTREHLLEVEMILSDGSMAKFGSCDLKGKLHSEGLEGTLYSAIHELLSDSENQRSILDGYPDARIPRRNTGYALDMLLRQKPYNPKGKDFNLCELIAGSEGTLAFVTEAKLKLSDIPSPHRRLVAIHCQSIDESLRANLVALEFNPSACELMDNYILDATERNREQRANRFFVEGSPKALLVIELIRNSEEKVEQEALQLINVLKSSGLGYAWPVLKGDDMAKAWELRKAGLGLLSNVPGDTKPVPVIEDTAVNVQDLPKYISEFNQLLSKHGLYSVHYAHAGSGELHLRPILNLKTEEGVRMFRKIAEEVAALVKSYKGSLSGEHGDGRLRGEFIPFMLGERNYSLLKEVKRIWDPQNIFNPGKIVDTAPMDSSLRFDKNMVTPEYETLFDFSENEGIVRATEQCNGAGDCRKSELTGGTMCPSYMATRDEKDTTRARANILREMLSRPQIENPFASKEIGEVLDLCLSCKGCKAECPSNVDMAKLKAEWQYQQQKTKGVSFRTNLIANYTTNMRRFGKIPWLFNATRNLAKPILGFAKKRSIPKMAGRTLRRWFETEFKPAVAHGQKVYFFFDEFTNYLDVEIGKRAILLLDRLGYCVHAIAHPESGRTFLSKGLLEEARAIAQSQISIFHPLLSEDTILVGIEPSTVLTFRDEYPDLLRGEEKEKARALANHVYLIDEFLIRELESGRISKEQFQLAGKRIKVHGHCHQKALSSMTPTKKLLVAAGHEVQMIPSGCCGMAGSFGYEKEHFDVSMKIGELVLFPRIRETSDDTIIVASGTSCRHQIFDGTGRRALHLVEVL